MTLLLLGLLACVGSSSTPGTDTSGTTVETHPAIDPPHHTVQLSVDEALATVEDSLAVGLPDVLELHALYEEVMGHRELGNPGCPTYEDPTSTGPGGNWFDRGCTTDEGWTYFGNAVALHIIGVNPDGYPIDAVGSSASFQITDPDGEVFVGGGGYNLDRLLIGDGRMSLFGTLGGTYSYGAAEGWLKEGVEVSLFFDGELNHMGVGDTPGQLRIDGGVGRAEGQISFRELIIERGETMRLSGQIDLRDPSGCWFHLALEGSERPCGTLSAEGIDDQEACLSDSVLVGLDTLVDSLETM
ncbi:hypothetical protein L6R49_25840 [Myxococcota bacterium]|nr:hypothetical protein [Myxococcota bacterium]